MTSIFDMLTERLGGDTVEQISRTLGADRQTTGNAIGAAVPALLAALSRNAARSDGAESLHAALQRDHDGSVLDDPRRVIDDPRAANGDGILRHVLGSRRSSVETGISRATGLGDDKTQNLMAMLAPLVMGALGKQQRQGGLDTGALAGLLGQERQKAAEAAPQGLGMLEQLLDADDDGDVDLGDLVKHGSGLLGKMFK
ncbi:MAG: DUF937 domain-containing protein [Planctomycetota bacterium]